MNPPTHCAHGVHLWKHCGSCRAAVRVPTTEEQLAELKELIRAVCWRLSGITCETTNGQNLENLISCVERDLREAKAEAQKWRALASSQT